MSLRLVIDELIAEHGTLTAEWREIEKTISEVKHEEPKTKQEKYDFLKPLTDIFGRSHLFASKFKVHEIKEERLVFTEMAERGKESLVHRLLDDHRRIDELLENMRRLLEDYRFGKISAKDLVEKILKTHQEITNVVTEHIKIEDQEFRKL